MYGLQGAKHVGLLPENAPSDPQIKRAGLPTITKSASQKAEHTSPLLTPLQLWTTPSPAGASRWHSLASQMSVFISQ
jgi:hypothetical protein